MLFPSVAQRGGLPSPIRGLDGAAAPAAMGGAVGGLVPDLGLLPHLVPESELPKKRRNSWDSQRDALRPRNAL